MAAAGAISRPLISRSLRLLLGFTQLRAHLLRRSVGPCSPYCLFWCVRLEAPASLLRVGCENRQTHQYRALDWAHITSISLSASITVNVVLLPKRSRRFMTKRLGCSKTSLGRQYPGRPQQLALTLHNSSCLATAKWLQFFYSNAPRYGNSAARILGSFGVTSQSYRILLLLYREVNWISH